LRPTARAAAAAIAAGCFASGAILAAHHPIAPAWALAAYVVWCCAVAWRPSLWLPLLIAALPAAGLAPWSGWLVFEEWDLLALGAAAGAYGATAWRPRARVGAPVRGGAAILVALFVLSSAFALARGFVDAGGFAFGGSAGYYDPLNSARVLKGFAFALLLWPVSGARALDAIGRGFAAAFGVAALAVLWERAAFPGVLDFSSDYRATGSFWEMHVGGAALDGFLLLTFPFALWQTIRCRRPLAIAAMALVAGAGLYAMLATFSRGVYVAVPASLAVLALKWPRRDGAHAVQSRRALGGAIGVAAAAAVLSLLVFRSGGYRALAAVLAVFALALAIAEVARAASARDWLVALAGAAVLSALCVAASAFVWKGPYAMFALASGLCAWQLLPTSDASRATPSRRLAAFSWAVMMAAFVAFHWGGASALRDTSAALTVVIAAVVAGARARTSLVPVGWRARAAAFGIAAFVAAVVAVFSGGAYMTSRFATGESDFEGRLHHWRDGVRMLDGPVDWLLGKGLGRFPANYLVHVQDSVFPGTYRLASHDGGAFVTLAGPRYPTSFGDLFRLSQRVRPLAGAYVAFVDVRASQPVRLHVEICEKHLLYAAGCAIAAIDVNASAAWQRRTVPLDGSRLGGGSWYAPRLGFFSLAVETSARSVDIDNVSLVAPSGADALVNGDYSRGMARWFFTSDRYHLPWHIKNLALDVLFDQGLIGVALLALIVALALRRLGRAAREGSRVAASAAAALAGFIVVGAFDSLIDVPRVAFAFHLLVLIALASDGDRSIADRNAALTRRRS
jgi:hypothetical protein